MITEQWDMYRFAMDALLFLYNLVDECTHTVRNLDTELVTVMQQVLRLERPSHTCWSSSEDDSSRLEGRAL